MLGRALVVLGSVLVSGCSEDLPPGWEGAEHVTKLTQSECGGNAYESESSATFLPGKRKLTLEYEHAHFRCQQEVEGFYKDAGGMLEVLVQPVDMDPGEVASCDCIYDIDIVIESLASGSRQAILYRRGDNINVPNDPVVIDAEPIVIE